jgi:hypothetical protein
METLLAVVAPTLGAPGILETGTALSILTALFLVSAVFARLSAEVEREYSLIADEFAAEPPTSISGQESILDPDLPTGILLVNGYNRFGLGSLLAFWHFYRDCFQQLLILGIDSDGGDADRLRRSLRGYLSVTRAMNLETGLQAVGSSDDPVTEAERSCLRLVESFRAVVFCAGRPELRPRRWFHRYLPAAVCEDVRIRLRRRGLPFVSLPVRLEKKKAAAESRGLSRKRSEISPSSRPPSP